MTSTQKIRGQTIFLDLHECINKQLLGTETNPSQWECLHDQNEKHIGTMTTENTKVRRLIDNFELLINMVIVPDRRDDWIAAVSSHRLAMKILREKEDLSDEEVVEFQGNVDVSFDLWVKL